MIFGIPCLFFCVWGRDVVLWPGEGSWEGIFLIKENGNEALLYDGGVRVRMRTSWLGTFGPGLPAITRAWN